MYIIVIIKLGDGKNKNIFIKKVMYLIFNYELLNINNYMNYLFYYLNSEYEFDKNDM